jgi:hypothetical protein
VGSILEVKIQPVMRRFKLIVVLSLLFVIFSWQAFSQCPEKVALENRTAAASDVKELIVYDSFDSNVNISGFEINIFNGSTGSYLITESSNFPSIAVTSDVVINKSGNRIQLRNIPEDIDLLRCIVIFIGEECPVKKILISDQ